jgi:hypothetical protein
MVGSSFNIYHHSKSASDIGVHAVFNRLHASFDSHFAFRFDVDLACRIVTDSTTARPGVVVRFSMATCSPTNPHFGCKAFPSITLWLS